MIAVIREGAGYPVSIRLKSPASSMVDLRREPQKDVRKPIWSSIPAVGPAGAVIR